MTHSGRAVARLGRSGLLAGRAVARVGYGALQLAGLHEVRLSRWASVL